MMHWKLTLLALTAAVAWAVLPVAAQQTSTPTVTVARSDTHGSYLTDANGRALYLFTADQQGTKQAPAVSHCTDACAKAWPPFVATGEPHAGLQVSEPLLGTIQRQDGTRQVTYNGWPLYHFSKDQSPGQTAGQDVHGFGGEWYLVQPEGTRVTEKH